MHSVSQTKANEILHLGTSIKQPRKGKNSVLVPTLLCTYLLFSRNNSGNNWWPLGAASLFFVYAVLDENVDFFRSVWAKSTHFVPWIFKMEREKNDFYTYFSVYMVCIFANENKDVISKDFFKNSSININGKRRRFDRTSVIVNWKGEKKDWRASCAREKGKTTKALIWKTCICKKNGKKNRIISMSLLINHGSSNYWYMVQYSWVQALFRKTIARIYEKLMTIGLSRVQFSE